MQNIEEFIRMFNLWNNFNTKKKNTFKSDNGY